MLPGRTTPLRRGQKRSLRGGGEDHDQTLSTKPPTTPQLTPGAGLATCGPATGVASGDHTRPTSLAGGSRPAPPPRRGLRHHAPMGAPRPPMLLARSGERGAPRGLPPRALQTQRREQTLDLGNRSRHPPPVDSAPQSSADPTAPAAATAARQPDAGGPAAPLIAAASRRLLCNKRRLASSQEYASG